jgi:hypothetical protein
MQGTRAEQRQPDPATEPDRHRAAAAARVEVGDAALEHRAVGRRYPAGGLARVTTQPDLASRRQCRQVRAALQPVPTQDRSRLDQHGQGHRQHQGDQA